MKLTTLANYLTILDSKKETFYASDFGFSGGEIGALVYEDLIETTGEQKEVWFAIDDDTMKRGFVKQWKVLTNHEMSVWAISKLYDELQKYVKFQPIIKKILDKQGNFENYLNADYCMKVTIESILGES
jgi:hypothetical protein